VRAVGMCGSDGAAAEGHSLVEVWNGHLGGMGVDAFKIKCPGSVGVCSPSIRVFPVRTQIHMARKSVADGGVGVADRGSGGRLWGMG
jgi:hypothetical protein